MTQLSSRIAFCLLLTLISDVIDHQEAIAQITPDNSLGAENSRIRPDIIKNTPSDVIEGGASRGRNLFHSFREFNIKEGRGAYFANPAAIQNIFTRVTGGKVSNILGTLGVLGNANLFLINPNGIIFGPNARLDIRGAFIGSTANSLVFDNNFEFSATNPDAPPLLTVNMPIGLRFREQAGDISSTANLATPGNLTLQAGNLNLSGSVVAGGDLTLEALNTLTIRDTVESPFTAVSGGNLLLQGNQSVDIFALNHPNSGLFSGGDMVLRSTNTVGGDAHYWSGGNFRIEKLDGNLGNLYSPNDPVIRTLGDVFIGAYEGASLHIIAGGSVKIPGYILITGADPQFGLTENITLSNGQQINIDGKNNPTLDIRAGVSEEFIGTPFFQGSGFDSFFSPINLSIEPTSADINLGTIVFSRNPSDINQKITGDVLLTNQYQPNQNLQGSITITPNSSFQFTAIDTSSFDDGGRVTIDSRNNIGITGNVYSLAFGQNGRGGDILLNSVTDIFITNAVINVTGNISINTTTLSLTDGGQIEANTQGIGNAGKIQITAQDINITGESSLGFSSSINSFVSNTARGDSDGIEIYTSTLTLRNGGIIASNNLGIGNAGKISILASESIIIGESSFIDNSEINNIQEIQGNNEGIDICTSSLILENGGSILIRNLGSGLSGTINIYAADSILLKTDNKENSSLIQNILGQGFSTIVTKPEKDRNGNIINRHEIVEIASNPEATGNGGNIFLVTDKLSLTGGAKITTSTLALGNAGAIEINASDISIDGESIDGISSLISSNVAENAQGRLSDNGILINTNELKLTNGGGITATTFGKGNAGIITINADNSISLSGQSSQGVSSTIASEIGTNAQGNGQTITLNTNQLFLDNNAKISSKGSGFGDAGNITINAPTLVNLDNNSSLTVETSGSGQPGEITINSNLVNIGKDTQISASVRENSTNTQGEGKINLNVSELNISGKLGIFAETEGIAPAGSLTIKPYQTHSNLNIKFTDNGFISASTTASGNGGNITITAPKTINIQGDGKISTETSGSGNAGNINITTHQLNITDGVEITASTSNLGDSGNITLNALNLNLDNATIQALTTNLGNPGSILVSHGESNANQVNLTNNSVISTEINALGNRENVESANIIINTDQLFLDASKITASTTANRDAGNINILNSQAISLNNNSEITALTTGSGKAGNIDLSIDKEIKIDSGSILNVETQGDGKAGDIEINTPTLTIGENAELSVRSRSNATGKAGKITLNIDILNISGELGIFAETEGVGDAGNLTINPLVNNPNLTISFSNRGNISASTLGSGNGGDINITAPETINLNGNGIISVKTEGNGSAGTINISSQNLNLTDGIEINASTFASGSGGDINLSANFLNLNQSQINAFTDSTGNAGNIIFNYQGENAENLTLNNSTISTEIRENGIANRASNITLNTQQLNVNNNSQITASTQGKGDAGNITVPNAQQITLNQSSITASTSGEGDTGLINLNANQNIDLNNSNINSSVEQGAVGDSQQITLNTPNLNLTNNSEISAATAGTGNAGSIIVPDAEMISLDNSTISTAIAPTGIATQPSNITLNTQQLNLTNNSQITANTQGQGDAGTITITADTLDITEDSTIQTNTSSNSNAGDINLILKDRLALARSFIEAITSPNSTGKGGSIIIDPITVNLNNGAKITVNSQGEGDGGSIFLTANNLNLNNGSQISATTASGEGGNITLNIFDTLRQDNNSPLTATAGGTGNGGNITVNTNFLIRSGNSDITANAFEGIGGNIKITAQGIFQDLRSEITASSQLGFDGVVETNTPDVDPSRGLIDLPQNVVDPNSLISRNACRQGSQSEFTVRGRGGLPTSPEQVRSSDEVVVGLVDGTEEESSTQVNTSSRMTRKIVPAQGWQMNEKGEVVLLAYPTGNAVNRPFNSPLTCSSN